MLAAAGAVASRMRENVAKPQDEVLTKIKLWFALGSHWLFRPIETPIRL
jgi:hypothetical protein